MKRDDKNKRQGTRPEHHDDYVTFEFAQDVNNGLYTHSEYREALDAGYDLTIEDERIEWFSLYDEEGGDT